jgi:hypothetical protein
LELSTTGKFFDLGAKFGIPRSFVANRRRVVFEYDVVTGDVLCDGSYGQERDYTKHSPMTSWLIKVDNRGIATAPAAEIDFTAFTGIKMEFECEFVWNQLGDGGSL